MLQRDLIGPGPDDTDIARERLKNNPSRWYLTGFLAPALEGTSEGTESIEDEGDPLFSEEPSDPETGTGGGRAADDAPDDEPSARKSRVPSSCGITVLVDASVREVEVALSWGDYVTVPPLPDEVFIDEKAQYDPSYRNVQWQRVPGKETLSLPVPENGRGRPVLIPGSAGAQRPGGALYVLAHARPYLLDQPDGTKRHVKALTVMVINRRNNTRRRFSDVTFAFQMRLEVRCAFGLYPRANVTGYASSDADAALADLHYYDVAEYAVGCNTSAGWASDLDGVVRAAYTDFLPAAEVERVEPNEKIADVEFGMEALAALAASGPDALRDGLRDLPTHYETWIAAQEKTIAGIAGVPRQATARRLVISARQARDRIASGIALLCGDRHARLAFRAMNEAIARAARQREAGQDGDPSAQRDPRWRPFQLAFILLNLSGLQDCLHPDREVVDLLFFPTGGGKTEAYLGLAAWTIAHRRITNRGTLGAGVAVLMRYTLRLLTLDQLSRASGVVCALELMRIEPAWKEGDKHLLGDWPIEIGLWVGSAASPNRLGKTGDGRRDTAVARVRRYPRRPRSACTNQGLPVVCDAFFTGELCLHSDGARAAEYANSVRKPHVRLHWKQLSANSHCR
jgi:hypothetical protein